jgi:hypothetical protein
MRFLIILFLFLLTPVVVNAQNVSSPSVDKGAWEFNNFAVFAENDRDNDVFEQKTRIEYGVTDRLALTFSGEFEQVEGNSVEFENTEYRLVYMLTEDGAPINVAMRVLYDLDHSGDADSIGAELLFGQKFDKWRHLFNIDTAHEVGEKRESGLELDLAWGTYYSFDKFRLGGEYYVDFGNLRELSGYSEQAHQVGGSIKFDLISPVSLEFAYFAGISRGADDHVFKNEIEFEF